MRTAIITAVFGDHDNVKPLPDGHGFDDVVCVTDNIDLDVQGWRMVVEPRYCRPALAAKFAKMQPFTYVDTDIAVWIDAAWQVMRADFKDFCINALGDNDIVVWRHPDKRRCLYHEAAFCQRIKNFRKEPIAAQVAHYRAEGMPERLGLWACGTIVWRNSNAVINFGNAWLAEVLRWSARDQIAFPFLVWKLAPKVGVFPAHEFRNPYLRWHRHKR